MNMRPATQEMVILNQLNLHGDVIPPSWYKQITLNGKPHLPSIIILADIVYWFRPRVIRDEQTGEVVGLERKMQRERLHRSLKFYENSRGLTKKQTRIGFNLLRDLGLIEWELVKENDRVNMRLINIKPYAIKKISEPHPQNGKKRTKQSGEGGYALEGIGVCPPGHTNTEITNTETICSSKKMNNEEGVSTPKKDNSANPSKKRKRTKPAGLEPKPKNHSKKNKRETKPNLKILDFWNKQPNLTTHRPNSKTYQRSLEKIHQLRTGKLNIKNPKNNGIPASWYTTPWSIPQILNAIKRFNDMHYQDMWPEKKSSLAKTLDDAVLNRKGTSWLMLAYKYGTKEIYNPMKGVDEYTKKQYDKLEDVLVELRNRKLSAEQSEKLLKVADNIRSFHEQLPKEKPLSGEIFHQFPNWGSVVTDYAKHLREKARNLRDIGPNGIDVNANLWNSFIKEMEDYLGVHFRTGTRSFAE